MTHNESAMLDENLHVLFDCLVLLFTISNLTEQYRIICHFILRNTSIVA